MKHRKILIDGSPLFHHKTGIEHYLHRLYSALFAIDSDNQYTVYGFLFFGKKLKYPFQKKYPNVRYRMVRFLPSVINNFISTRIVQPPADLITGTKPDVVLFGNFVRSPLLFGAKSITAIYDLSYIKYRQYADSDTAELLIKKVPFAARKSDVILTISEHSKHEINEYYHVPLDKIEIVHPAVDHEVYYPRPLAEIQQVRKSLKLKKKYILYTGTLEPRKNIEVILEAYALLDKKLLSEYSLVLAGGKGWMDDGILAKLKQLKDLDIITTGYVQDEDLPALYSGASVFVYPSLYEGFGMPPLEAMACGVPVITSNNSSLPEVVGDAGIMLDADDTTGLSKAISRVLSDPKLRSRMKKSSLTRAQNFSWAKSARKLQGIINKI